MYEILNLPESRAPLPSKSAGFEASATFFFKISREKRGHLDSGKTAVVEPENRATIYVSNTSCQRRRFNMRAGGDSSDLMPAARGSDISSSSFSMIGIT